MKMKMKSLIATSIILALSACNDDGITPEAGNSIGSVAIVSSDAYVDTLLTASVTDGNSVDAESISYVWKANGTAITGETSDSYLLIEDDIGKTITVLATYTDNDGYSEAAQSAATDAISLIPVNTAGSVAITGNAYVDSTLTADITDVNGTGTVVYTWMADGGVIADATASTYTLTTAELGYAITVQTVYTDNDGFAEDTTSMATVAVIEEPSGIIKTQVAAITDTMGKNAAGTAETDTGELRLDLNQSGVDIGALESGKLTLSFKKTGNAANNNPDDRDSDGVLDTSNKDAYIGLYGSKVSSSYDIVELRIQDGGYAIRNQDGITITDTFTDNDWVEVEVTWDASSASDSVTPLVTLTIDGTPVSSDAFNSAEEKSDVYGFIKDGLQYLSFKIGDNDATVAASFYIDNIKLYSDTAGTTLVFEDDFEAPVDANDTGYDVGDSLDKGVGDSPYNNSTNEAVVAEVEAAIVL